MSDESITHREDKEDLMYIYRKVNLENQYQLGEDLCQRESSTSSDDSTSRLKCLESDINIHNLLSSKQIGPEAYHDPEMVARTKPFDFLWTYGINAKTGLINLTNENRREIFFSSSHFPILYNYCTKQMKCLEGHQYVISSISADQTGQWLATADDNKDGCIIIWDSFEYNPVYTLFNVYPISGTMLIKLSGSARYLITIGSKNEKSYSVDFWLWTLGNEVPEDSFEVDKSHGVPVEVCFNPNIEEFIMLVFKKQVFLLVWDNEKKKFTKPKIPRIINQNKIGTLTTGTYINNCHECYALSNKGCVLVFGNTLYAKPFEEGELDNSKIYINAIKISEYALRSCAALTSSLVIGDASGALLFFDKTVRILYWFKSFSLAPIVSISFNRIPKFKREDATAIYTVKPSDSHIFECNYTDITAELEIIFKTNLPKDASLKRDPFLVTDFFIGTMDSNVYAVDFLNSTCTPVFLMADDYVSAIEIHDEFPYIVIGYANGRIHLVDYDQNELVCTTLLPKTEECTVITCLKYSPESLHLVCGRENGEIWILEPIVLKHKIDAPFRPTKSRVVKIVFSLNKAQFAYYDIDKTVVLFVYIPETCEWLFAGKIRSHYENINDIMFVPNSNSSVLVTIGSDRHFVEYNNNNMEDEEFGIAYRERIEQRAIPLHFIYWTEIVGNTKYGYFFIADNEFKFKLMDPETKIPKCVILAPAFGCFKNQNIRKMLIIPKSENRYMVFLTNKYIGVHIMLPDGNPYRYVGYLGHSSQLSFKPNTKLMVSAASAIAKKVLQDQGIFICASAKTSRFTLTDIHKEVMDFHLSPDGKYLFTFGAEDHSVFKWKIRPKAVELMHVLGGKELEPFYCLIEGGKNGWLFQEIKDLFYYMQILQQDTIDFPRRVSDTIHISELAELVRTCGFFPSEFELENMMIDIKYRNYHETGILNEEISFIDYVKLFCNHKPVYGYSKDDIKRAFETIIQNSDSPSDESISREEFSSIIAYSGEFISPGNLLKFFKTLLRSDDSSGSLNFLPEEITFNILCEEILGVDKGRSTMADKDGGSDDPRQDSDISD